MNTLNSTIPLISVVVCTYKREKILCDTLDLLLKQEYPSFEVIVVDQTPNHLPTTVEFLRSRATKMRYYLIEYPSLPGARNFGIKKAHGEIILFVDDDVEPTPNLISAHAAAYTEASIGGVAGQRTYPPSSHIHDPGGPVGIIRRNGVEGANFSTTKYTEVEWAPGCNMSFRKQLLTEAGGFETSFIGTAAYEEIDLCARLRSLGYRIVFIPEASLVHMVESSGGCMTRQKSLRLWYSFIHNSLLFSWRNRTASHKLRALGEAYGTISALIRQRHPFKMTLPLLFAVPHSFLSHWLARKTRPNQPYPLLPIKTQ
jgi:GT2 family glycosyltransferase